jgi:DNA-binding NtrC family response regulator
MTTMKFDTTLAHTDVELARAIPMVVFQPGMSLEDIERSVILQTLVQQRFNRTHTARALGIGLRTLQRKIKQYRASIEIPEEPVLAAVANL